MTRRTDLDVEAPNANEGGYDFKETDNGTVLMIPKVWDLDKTADEQIIQYGKAGEFAKPKEPVIPFKELPAAQQVFINQVQNLLNTLDLEFDAAIERYSEIAPYLKPIKGF